MSHFLSVNYTLTPEQLAHQKIGHGVAHNAQIFVCMLVKIVYVLFSVIFLYSRLTRYTTKHLLFIAATFYRCAEPLKCCCCLELHFRGCREKELKSCPNLPNTTDSHWHSFCKYFGQGGVHFPSAILNIFSQALVTGTNTAFNRKPCIINRTELSANCKAIPPLTILNQFSKDIVFVSELQPEIAVFTCIHLLEH